MVLHGETFYFESYLPKSIAGNKLKFFVSVIFTLLLEEEKIEHLIVQMIEKRVKKESF